MKIRMLHIYGYGKFTNKTFHFSSSPLQIIYGYNESGKTTLMNFISDMLFGFSKQSRYMPKQGGAYGGMLMLEHDELGEVKIERTGNKSDDVRVLLPDGRVENGSFLDMLLLHIDRSLFQSIYSFDVFGLQDVHKLNRDKLGHFLFFSSLFGSDTIAKMDSHLKKEQEALFKPNGRKPELNRSLEDLKQTAIEWKKAVSQSQEYQSILKNKKKSEEELGRIEQKLGALQAEKEQINQSIGLKPKIEEEIRLARELETEESIRYERFPEDGLHLLEKYESHLHPKAAKLAALREDEKKQRSKLNTLPQDNSLLEKEEEIAHLLSTHPIYESQMERLQAIDQELQRYRTELSAGLQKLKGKTEADIAHVDYTYEYEWRLMEDVQAYLQLKQKKSELDEQFNEAKADLDEAEKTYALSAKSILSEELRKQKAETLADLERTHYANAGSSLKREEAEKQLAELRKEESSRKKRHTILFSVLAVFCIAASFVCFLADQRAAAILLLPVTLVLLYFGLKAPKSSSVVEMMEKQVAGLKTNQPSKEDIESIQRLKEELWLDDQNKQRLMAEKQTLMQREAAYERVINGFEEWESKMHPVKKKVDRYLEEFGLAVDPAYLPDAYSLMKHLNEHRLQIQTLESEKNKIMSQTRSFDKELARFLPGSEASPAAERIFQLKKLLQEQKHAGKLKEEAMFSLQHINDQIRSLENETNYFQSQIDHLFNSIQASSGQEFRAYAKAHNNRMKMKDDHRRLSKELVSVPDIVKEFAACSINELKAQAEAKLQQIKETKNELKKTHERIAYLQLNQKEIEQSGLESELAHKLMIQKNESKELAKKWGAIQLAREAIRNRIDYHQKVRLPLLLKKAGELIEPLTDGRYVKLFFSEEDQILMVTRKDGLTFYANELSQATCEQIYTAIRFSLALVHEKGLHMPFFMDDSFVHFDGERLVKVSKVIEKWAGTNQQVLLFTCHGHIKETFSKGEVTSLS